MIKTVTTNWMHVSEKQHLTGKIEIRIGPDYDHPLMVIYGNFPPKAVQNLRVTFEVDDGREGFQGV